MCLQAGITRDLEPYANLKPGEKPVIAGVCEQGTTIQVLGKAVTAEGQVRGQRATCLNIPRCALLV